MTESSTEFSNPSTAENELLVFSLGESEYAVDILKVQEIRRYQQITRVANVPAFVKGVTNLRGNIVPIIGARTLFGMDAAEAKTEAQAVVIVFNLGVRMVGLLVDSVSDVLRLSTEQIKPAPDFGAAAGTQHVKGLASLDDRMLIIVDVETMLGEQALRLSDQAAAAVA